MQIYQVPVASSEVCQEIIDFAEPLLQPATVTDGYGRKTAQSRTSYTAKLIDPPDGIQQIRERFSHIAGLPLSHIEVPEVSRYKPGQYFKAHYDSVRMNSSAGRFFAATGGARLWTMLLFLNDGFSGGHTRFPVLGKDFVPETGQALVWTNTTGEQHEPDPQSLHAGDPVMEGTKYVLTMWARQNPHPRNLLPRMEQFADGNRMWELIAPAECIQIGDPHHEDLGAFCVEAKEDLPYLYNGECYYKFQT